MNAPDFVMVIVSKREVVALDTGAALGTLRTFVASPDAARRWFECVDISIQGYDHRAEELFEIPEVRAYVAELDKEFPYWLFFLSKRHLGLQFVTHCFLPPFLTQEAKVVHFPPRLDQLLETRWFPAMNEVCRWVGMSGPEIDGLSDRCVEYLLKGPLRPATK